MISGRCLLTLLFVLFLALALGVRSARNTSAGFTPAEIFHKAGGGGSSELPADSGSSSDLADVFKGTAGSIEKRYQVERVVILEDMRLGRHPSYDRIVFEFQQNAPTSYRIEYVDKPVYQCGSGEAVWLAGDGWLSITFWPAQAHDARGQSTVADRGQLLDLPVIRELQNTCDFEGELSWVLGVSSPNKYRVLELRSPTRLVVDIQH